LAVVPKAIPLFHNSGSIINKTSVWRREYLVLTAKTDAFETPKIYLSLLLKSIFQKQNLSGPKSTINKV